MTTTTRTRTPILRTLGVTSAALAVAVVGTSSASAAPDPRVLHLSAAPIETAPLPSTSPASLPTSLPTSATVSAASTLSYRVDEGRLRRI